MSPDALERLEERMHRERAADVATGENRRARRRASAAARRAPRRAEADVVPHVGMLVEVRHQSVERWGDGEIVYVTHAEDTEGRRVPIVTAHHPGGSLTVTWPHRDIRLPEPRS